MKKQILNLGKVLSKSEQKQVNGAVFGACDGFEMYYVDDCSQCENILLPGAPTLCHNNCCVMAY
ncbi:hypothetical protein [Tenacibaculum sp. IB213877]|uniref:hypothetical protein n=1 Tax=Tenacibaculum sp. IB213877 TaxID=3097351 RepID=UPI002A59D232|nr:hypothetical protein [Tenacibaculum sp. IB213877]MDY0780806.1 hypothetical protein [Tenacibaculum sp. IB213877]